MADEFRREYDRRCGKGGVKCYCCNDWKGKDKAKLRRMVRRMQKINYANVANEVIAVV